MNKVVNFYGHLTIPKERYLLKTNRIKIDSPQRTQSAQRIIGCIKMLNKMFFSVFLLCDLFELCGE